MSANPPDSARQHLVKCPSCGASVEVADVPAVKCRYCGTSVPVPAEFRPQKPQVIIQQITPDYTQQYTQAVKTSSRAGCVITVVILVLTLGIVGYSLFAATSSVQTVLDTVQTSLQDSGIRVEMPNGKPIQLPGVPVTEATPAPTFASIVLEFGEKGNGPGLMDDARYVAIDKDGNIWTADYQDGRVQKFDPSGKFELLIQVPPDKNDNNYIGDLAADYAGNLYVTRGGDILKYSIADGELLATFAGNFPDTRYESLAIDATNTVYALHTTASDNSLIKLDANGKTLQRWDEIVTSVNKKDAAMDLGVAVDGVGNIYIASSFGNQVYIYDKSVKFVDRFGQQGSEPGQFSSPRGIVVDGQRHVYVHSSRGIDQFDTGGRYLGSLPINYQKGAPMGLTVDREGFVYVVTNQGKVLKYQLTDK
jgi:hypothetical protein